MDTLKPQSTGPLYSCSTAIGTLAVDGWAVTFGTAMRGLGGLGHIPLRNIAPDSSSRQNKYNTNKIYIAPGILKRIRAQTHGVTRR